MQIIIFAHTNTPSRPRLERRHRYCFFFLFQIRLATPFGGGNHFFKYKLTPQSVRDLSLCTRTLNKQHQQQIIMASTSSQIFWNQNTLQSKSTVVEDDKWMLQFKEFITQATQLLIKTGTREYSLDSIAKTWNSEGALKRKYS